jgi:hypothetical protein
MSTQKAEFKRVGPPKVKAKDVNGFLTVEISLNGYPDYIWVQDYLRLPLFITDGGVHPSSVFVESNIIIFVSFESDIKANVERMDKYIQQANDGYNRKKADELLEEKNLLELERKRKEELDRINETLKDL